MWCLCTDWVSLEFLEVKGLRLRETEKPNVSGYSAKRRLSSVLLPVPEGPKITTGLHVWTARWGLVESSGEAVMVLLA